MAPTMTSKLTAEERDLIKCAANICRDVNYLGTANELRKLLAPTQQPSGDVVDDKCVYFSVRFKDAVVQRSITTAELDSFAS
ncbi:hypothetical protein WJ86_16605 [Burkholderia multivorans]|nr:hypothetical protein WJ86_16605 [Burkholderia multivorans]PRE99029.1 hypothetical protein C6Q05_16195 [Burkholderia multivorans]